jgi:hypothetical protein
MLRMKVKQNLATAETLKKRIREINSNSPTTITTASSPSENRKFVFLYSINKLFSL